MKCLANYIEHIDFDSVFNYTLDREGCYEYENIIKGKKN